MRRLVLLSLVLSALVLASPLVSQEKPDPHVASTDPRTPEEEKKTFHLPPGFDIELVAAEPEIQKPMNLAFDDRGRLWVTDTVEYPYPATGDRKPRDTVKILQDFGPDGRARRITTFADGLNIPIGVLPLPGSAKSQAALVYSIPAVTRLTDSDGDQRADRRETLIEKYGVGDTHGMTSAFTWGFDGWIYACHGFANNSSLKGTDGKTLVMNSGNTYRFRPDGSRLQQFTWGQVNPFGLTFDPSGHLYSADCHSQPIYLLLRGGYYPSFGKPHDGLGFAPEMINNYQGSTAISGVAWNCGDHFPASFRDTAFVGDVVTTRINQFALEWFGATPRAIQKEFLRSDDPWFRPVDLKFGPDGALYVADFYNRIIGHYEVPLNHPGRDRHRGRIWRIVYRGNDGKGKPAAPRADWVKASTTELVQDLGHASLTVRTLASNQLASREKATVAPAVLVALRTTKNPLQKVHALWVLERLDSLDEASLPTAATDAEEVVRIHVQRILSERAKLSVKELLLARQGLKDSSPFVRRAAAEAVGQHPDVANIRSLLDLRQAVDKRDSHLTHTVRMALRNQLVDDSAWQKLRSSLDRKDRAALADVALALKGDGPAGFLLDHLRETSGQNLDVAALVQHIARNGKPTTLASLVEFTRGYQPDNVPLQALLVRSFERGTSESGQKLSDEARRWGVSVADRLLQSTDAMQLQTGLELVGGLRLLELQGRITEIVARTQLGVPQRLAALNTLVSLDGVGQIPFLGRLLLEDQQPPAVRAQVARLLGQLNQPAAHALLVKGLQIAPSGLQVLIGESLASTRDGANVLLQSIDEGKASARLLQERAVDVRLKASGLADLEKRLEKLTSGLPRADVRIQQLLVARAMAFRREDSSPTQGLKVFEQHCASCHQIGGKGAKVGPQLDGIGLRGVERLLEDTLDPNRNIDQAFRATTLTLRSGQIVSGLFLREEGAVLVLADNQGKEVRVPKESVEERSLLPLSPMPANFAEQIPEKDFQHLLRYLLSQKPEK